MGYVLFHAGDCSAINPTLILIPRLSPVRLSSITCHRSQFLGYSIEKRIVCNMDKITDKIAALPSNGNYFSLEFFPPKTDMVSNSEFSHSKYADSPRAHRTSEPAWLACPGRYDHCLSQSPGAPVARRLPDLSNSPRSASAN